MTEYMWPEMDILADRVVHEAIRAAGKYPNTNGMFLSLLQECGELATQLHVGSKAKIQEEAVQVAALALRIAAQGDTNAADAFCPLRELAEAQAENDRLHTFLHEVRGRIANVGAAP